MIPDARSADPAVAELQRALSAHQPADPREERSRLAVLEALATMPRPFDRHADLTHVTASAIVVGPRGVLLHLHRRLHRWLQPGGHLESGERASAGALREGEEETGLVLYHPGDNPTLVHVDVHGAADDHVHLDVRYLLHGPDADPAPPPEESQEVRWFPWSEAEAVADDALVGALRTARRLSGTGTRRAPGRTSEETDG